LEAHYVKILFGKYLHKMTSAKATKDSFTLIPAIHCQSFIPSTQQQASTHKAATINTCGLCMHAACVTAYVTCSNS